MEKGEEGRRERWNMVIRGRAGAEQKEGGTDQGEKRKNQERKVRG